MCEILVSWPCPHAGVAALLSKFQQVSCPLWPSCLASCPPTVLKAFRCLLLTVVYRFLKTCNMRMASRVIITWLTALTVLFIILLRKLPSPQPEMPEIPVKHEAKPREDLDSASLEKIKNETLGVSLHILAGLYSANGWTNSSKRSLSSIFRQGQIIVMLWHLLVPSLALN